MVARIGVTGASGFIGKQLVQRLLKEGYNLSVFTRSDVTFPQEINVIKGDLNNTKQVDLFLKDVDIVVHLAARQLPPDESFFQENVLATNTLITRAQKFPIKQLIFLSTMAVYGDQENKKITESDSAYPNTYYGVTKLIAENICHYWQSQSKAKLTILRPYNIYGIGSNKGVIYNMLQSIKRDNSVTIYGDGKQTRNFLYVDDIVNAIMISLEKESTGTFNLGSDRTVSLLDLVTIIETITSSKIDIIFKDGEKGKTNGISYSLNSAHEILGWKALVSLEEGLRKLV